MPANSIGRRRDLSAAMRCAASRSPEGSAATMPMRKGPAIALAQDSALRVGEEVQDVAHFGAAGGLRLELGARLLERQLAAVEDPIGPLEREQGLGREA